MSDKLFSVTINDCRVDTYRGSGKGGQKRNKTSSAVRIVHPPSGAMGQAEDGRSQLANKKLAFGRMARTKEMQTWLKIEACRVTGELGRIAKKVERGMQNVRVEVKSEVGTWISEA